MEKRRLRSDSRQEPPSSKVFMMDGTVAEYIRRTVLQIPRSETLKILAEWKFLSDAQLESLKSHKLKENLSLQVVQLCEENCATIKQAADLDIIYNYIYRDKKLWKVYRMTREGDENDIFDLSHFKKKFKESLQSSLKNITITFKEYEDNAIWIRIAWGTQYTQPNQYKPSYVVYHSQTPYVFTCHSKYSSRIPLLYQALLVATSYNDIQEMKLRSRCLDTLKDIVFKQYNQRCLSHRPQSLQEKNSTLEKADPRIIQEDKQETFGDSPLPKLELAEYLLETTLKSKQNGILDNKEPFRCMIKFSSPHLLEALKTLAPAGIADAPLSPLLTCITKTGRNYFKIREKKGAHCKSFPGQ